MIINFCFDKVFVFVVFVFVYDDDDDDNNENVKFNQICFIFT